MKKQSIIISLFILLCACSPLPSSPKISESEGETSSDLSDNAVEISTLDWNDRSIFTEGLIKSQQEVLDELPNAPIYHINLTIENNLVQLSAHQEVRFTNQEDVQLDEVVFHLYPNILGGNLKMTSVQVNHESVSADYELYDSVMHVPLQSSLSPGESTYIQLDYEVTVPKENEQNYSIFVYEKKTLSLAHFFPIVSVYDDAGWDIEIPPEQGDLTYADASFYVVSITAPKNLVLVTSGIEISREVLKNLQNVVIAAGPVRDFYISGSKDYQKQSRVVGEVTINGYASRTLQDGAIFAVDTVERALLDFNDRYGPYPYKEFDVVTSSTSAYGVEYPGITAIGLHIFDLTEDIDGVPVSVYLESTVAHEFGHQYFYNMVGSDQLEEPWLDEALVQYVTWQYYKDQYGSDGEQGFRGSLEERWNRVEMEKIPIGMPVASYHDKEYGAIVYGRGPLFFEALMNQMGQKAFDEFLKEYLEKFSWENATGESFKQLAEQHCSCDLTSLFEEWVY